MAHSFASFQEVESAGGIVLFLSPEEEAEARTLLMQRQEFIESLEVKFVFSVAEHASLQELAAEFEMEYEWQDFAADASLKVVDTERVGLARVLEAVEVGCAPLAQLHTEDRPDPPTNPDSDRQDTNTQDNEMRDIEVFEELMEKVRIASETASSLSDEERRRQAERIILEVAQRLGIDEGELA